MNIVVIPPHRRIPLRVLRVLVFVILVRLYWWLEWCELWILLNLIMRHLVGGRIPIPAPPWPQWNGGEEDEEMKEDDKEKEDEKKEEDELKEWKEILARALRMNRSNVRDTNDTIEGRIVASINCILKEYGRILDSKVIEEENTSEDVSDDTPVCIVYGECIGEVERRNSDVPCHFRNVIRAGIMTVMRATNPKAFEFEEKHLLFESVREKCCTINSCEEDLKNIHIDTNISLFDVVRRVETVINQSHTKHHNDCVVMCKNKVFLERARKRLIEKLNILRSRKINVVSILVTGSTGSSVVDEDFVIKLKTLGVSVVQKCRHPSSALYDAENSVGADGTMFSSPFFFLLFFLIFFWRHSHTNIRTCTQVQSM